MVGHVVPLRELLAAHATVVGVVSAAAEMPLAMLVEVGDLRERLVAAGLLAHERTLARVQSHVVVQICYLQTLCYTTFTQISYGYI